MRFILTIIWAAIWLPLDAHAAGGERFIPDCAGRVAIAHAHVAGVERGGALTLSDGRAVMLEGIRLPPEQALQDRALTALRAMALPGSVSFTTNQPQNDRHGRLRVQGFGALWLQAALLEQGLARVAIAPDRTECFPDLYEAEARARARHAGLWALVAYRVRAPSELKDAVGSFQLVEGKVSNIGRADGRIFIDFGGRQTVSAVIAADDHRAFRDFDLDGLPGHRIRIRGIVQDYRGRPEILLSSPAQIEVLD